MMKCPTPHMTFLHGLERLKRSTRQLSAQIGFIMDNVLSVQNLSHNFPDVVSSLEYFSDPLLYNFTEKDSVKEFKGEVLIIRVSIINTVLIQQ